MTNTGKLGRWRKLIAWLTAIAATAGVLYGAAWWLFPLELRELQGRYQFWRAGIVEIEHGGLHGYLRDHCAGIPKERCGCVALIHGLADNALTWKKILLVPGNGWPEKFKIYAFDLPGAGDSPPPLDLAEYGVRRQAAKLKSVLAPLCSSWIVVGNSMGGWIAAWLALDWPAGVNKLLLAGSAGLKPEGKLDLIQKSFFMDPTVESLKEFQRRAYASPNELPDYLWEAAVKRMRATNSRQVSEAQTAGDYLDGRLASIRRPTIVLWGAEDRIIPPAVGRVMQEQIPGSEWKEVPACGHLPQKECPLPLIKAIEELGLSGAI